MSYKFLAIGVVAGALLFLLVFIWLGSLKNENQFGPRLKPLQGFSLRGIQPEGDALQDDPKQTDKRASFAIFTNGTFRIFTDSRYHNQSSDVFLTEAEPNIVYVKKEGITWGDFFKTLPMTLSKECLTTGTGQRFCTGETGLLGFYLNGERDPNALDKEISDEDKLLVSFGSQNEEEIQSQLSQIPDSN